MNNLTDLLVQKIRQFTMIRYGIWAAAAHLFLLGGGFASAETHTCVYIFQDEIGLGPKGFVRRSAGPQRAIPLANLLGHWPHYEVRVRPIWSYRRGQIETCHATFYIGTSDETDVPKAFLDDFFLTEQRVAWVGFGARKLNPERMRQIFHHRAESVITIDEIEIGSEGFFHRVVYKEEEFDTAFDQENAPAASISVVAYRTAGVKANDHVLAWQWHNKTAQRIPYFLRAGNKFLIADIPYDYHRPRRNDRYYAFADLLFDILGESPRRQEPIAIGRLEDIHGFYDIAMLRSAADALRDEKVPVNLALIPLFADPANKAGFGVVRDPRPATERSQFVALMMELAKDPRNAILWHGVTHQLGEKPNPHSGTSGHDFEFWDKVGNNPVPGDSPTWVLDRLASGLSVFEAFRHGPRYWVTPHYEASALDNVVFGRVFPWIVGGVTYYASSFRGSFTLKAVSPQAVLGMPAVTREVIERVRTMPFEGIDRRSKERIAQDFPFEIYRDVYGQRVLPETLGYISVASGSQTSHARYVDHILDDAKRNRVVRDMWGSFFFHPYLLVLKELGGIGQYSGDASELKRLVVELKKLGYRFLSLEEFERSLGAAASRN